MSEKEKKGKKADPKNVVTLEPPKVKLTKLPMRVKCGNCEKSVETRLEHQNGHCAFICALCLTGVWCCCIPLCPGVNSCKDVHHVCPECEVRLGTFYKNYFEDT